MRKSGPPKITMSPVLVEIIVGLHVIFHDYKKICAWLLTKNPNFGNISPIHIINVGKGNKVLELINASLEGNTITCSSLSS